MPVDAPLQMSDVPLMVPPMDAGFIIMVAAFDSFVARQGLGETLLVLERTAFRIT